MADYFVAISEDGVRFKLKRDGTWEPDAAVEVKDRCMRFRSSAWGDDVTKVKSSEAAEPIAEAGDFLLYESTVGGFPAKVNFSFVNGLLYLGIYSFEQTHTNDNRFIDDFDRLNYLLTSKYGKPSEVNDLWVNDLFKDDYEQRGLAVSRGDHLMRVIWDDEETRIKLQMFGDNHEITLQVVYESKQLQPLATTEQKSKDMDGL